MNKLVRKLSQRPSIVLGGVLMLGVLEFVALQRSRPRRRRELQAIERQAAA